MPIDTERLKPSLNSSTEADARSLTSERSYRNSPMTNSQEHLINGLSGLLAGICGVIVGHPFDTIKVRLQVGDLKKQPVIGAKSFIELYRGLIPPLCTAGATQCMVFTIYEHIRRKYLVENFDYDASYLGATFAAASIAGGITSFLTSPFQLVKTQQQAAADEITMAEVRRNITQALGLRGFFHASTPVMIVEGVGRGIYMLCYEYYKIQLSGRQYGVGILNLNPASTVPDDGKLSVVRATAAATTEERSTGRDRDTSLAVNMVSAAAAGCTSWLVMYPLDSIKSRRLSDLTSTSFWQCLQQTWRLGGTRALYRGCGFAMLRSIPVAATILPLYEVIRCRVGLYIQT